MQIIKYMLGATSTVFLHHEGGDYYRVAAWLMAWDIPAMKKPARQVHYDYVPLPDHVDKLECKLKEFFKK